MTDSTAAVLALPLQGTTARVGGNVDVRSLIPGADQVHQPIAFQDVRWEFEGYPLVNQTVDYIDFANVPARWRMTVKDWALMRLNPELARTGASSLDTQHVMAEVAAAERPIGLPSAIAYVFGLGASLTVLEQIGVQHLRAEDWQDFAARMRRTYPNATAGTLAAYARPLLSVWRYRGVLGLPDDVFGGKPFNGWTVERLFRVPERRLNAVRPAAEHCGPLLGLSLWMLDHCAEDILTRLEVLASAPDRTGLPRDEQAEHVADALLAYERTGRPLPATRNLRTGEATAGWPVFVRLAGCSTAALRNPRGRAAKEFRRIRDLRGISTSEDGFGLSISAVPGPDGEPVPWIDTLTPTKYDLGLDYWTCTLAYACALTITMLTTVRERELAALPHDCIRTGTYERGDLDVPVTRMHGYLVKNRDEPVPASWVVSDDVVRAVAVLHRLKAALRLPPKVHPRTGREVLMHPDLGRARGETKGTDTLALHLGWLRWFRTAGEHFTSRGLLPPLPDLPNWLSHRALRITGIEAYASQAWGDALAAAQAHWSNRTVAEGYLGHLPRSVYLADPDSLAEVVDQDRAHALLDAANDLSTDPTAIQGNGTERVQEVLRDTGAADLVTGPVTPRQLNALARSTKHVFVGELTICVQGPGGLCGSETEADWLLCRPFACRNSGMTRAHRARLELRRRGWANRSGVFERARGKIEEDAPGLAEEFADLDDAALRALIIEDLPGRYARAAEEAHHDHDQP